MQSGPLICFAEGGQNGTTHSGFISTGSSAGQDSLKGITSTGEADKRPRVHYNANNWIPSPTLVQESVLRRSTILADPQVQRYFRAIELGDR